jgi:predicted metallopeptidase
MAVEYTRAPEEVEEIASEIIAAHHEHLEDVKIVFLMRSPTPRRGGRVVLGSASKASAKHRALAGENYRFIIELAADEWNDLTPEQKRALVDHELCHCCRVEDDKGEIVYSIRGHDVEEFQEIVERHGAWTEDLGSFTRQLELFKERPALKAVGE